jgi:hypothetical protein
MNRVEFTYDADPRAGWTQEEPTWLTSGAIPTR